jgi:uncharacterized protein YndB with AHSA1/START domain
MTNPTTITAEPGTPFIEMTREFDATPQLLFRAQTEPELVARWLGPRRHGMRIDEYDVRVGGQYRYTHIADDGSEFGFRGVFHTVEPGVLVIQTWEWDGMPGYATLETARFEDLGGRTRLTTRSVFPTIEGRDMSVQYGMADGMTESMERLDEVLGTLGS